MRASKPKDLYQSPYVTELVSFGNVQMVIQYLSTESKDDVVQRRKAIADKRMNDVDMRLTPYFETRCKNLVSKLYACKNGNELVSLLIKNTGVTLSGHFLYRDVIDIVNNKIQVLEFDDEYKTILDLIVKSLTLNNVIAPKIKAIYNLKFNEEDDS